MLRDPTIADSAKQRSLRVPLDYATRRNSLVRTKGVLVVAAAALATAYCAWLLTDTRHARRQLSPGPVAAVHATWNDDCLVCHQAMRALRSDSLDLLGTITRSKDNMLRGINCYDCHAAPGHHRATVLNEPSCSACHHEHQGLAADILRPSDNACLACHRDLSNQRSSGQRDSAAYESVTGFSLGGNATETHPDFRSLKSDPGQLKFNHWLHLQPGVSPSDGKNKLHVVDLPEDDRGRYGRKVAADGLVQLDCASCHEPQDDGRLMRPIAYEQHCQACHPMAAALGDQESIAVPHGMGAQRLQAVLDGLLFGHQRRSLVPASPSTDESGDLPLIPGRTLGKNLAQTIQRDVLGQRASLAAAVNAKCLQCHELGTLASGDQTLLAELLPSNIPRLWLKHARFDHRAHGHMNCRQCHAGAFAFENREQPRFVHAASGALAARDSDEVMIAGIEVCTTCHAPKRGETGGARHDCAECHAYHGRDNIGPGRRTGPEARLDAALSNGNAAQQMVSMLRLAAQTQTIAAVGTATCSSSNCHGSANLAAPAWKTAFTTWMERDPHVRAYDVLLTRRSLEITQRLAGKGEALSDEAHHDMLKERCSDCHYGGHSDMTDNVGVACEMCHGPAEQWLHAHDRRGFSRGTPGFVDTKDLAVRAQACLACHGRYQVKRNESDARQVVDHELIAAGHPRLAFELDAYLESLPAHWDRSADVARHAPAFHFSSWLSGQVEEQKQAPSSDERLPDFAGLDCFACHHALKADARRTPLRLDSLRRSHWPPAGLLAAEYPLDFRSRAALVNRFLGAAGDHERWQAATSALASVQAFSRDLPSSDAARLREPLHQLSSYLAIDSFPVELRQRRAPTIYDSPGEWDPRQLRPRIDAIRRVLTEFESSDEQR